jgi:DNA invertase Pin-like site-specific DNA recombinase
VSDDELRFVTRAAGRLAARIASAEGKLDELRAERLAMIERLFAAGLSTAEIARLFKLSRSDVGRKLGNPHERPGRPRSS